QDPGQQVADVAPRAGPDRAAEYEHEQQQEGDRDHRGGDEGVGATPDVGQGPAREDGGSAEEALAHGSCLVVARVVPARPTSARKTSSRDGCFSTYSTVAGGRRALRSEGVPSARTRPSCRIATRSASC